MKSFGLPVLLTPVEALLLLQPYNHTELIHKYRRAYLNKSHELCKMVLHQKEPFDFEFA